MALLFPRKTQAVVGIDIGSTSIKMVELCPLHKQLWLQDFAVVPLVPNAMTAAIQAAYTQMRTTTRHAAIAMPANTVISKTMPMDATFSEEELEAHIQLEAAAALPFPVDEVCMDFSVLGINETDPTKVDVLLVAARRAQVIVRCDEVIAAGLVVDYIDVETFAIERVVNYVTYKDAAKTIVLIHFDETAMTFMVLHQRRLIYTHEELFSAEPLTETTEFLAPLLRRAMQFFISATPNCTVEKILLSGTGVNALSAIVADCLSLPVTIIDPFHTLFLSAAVNETALQQAAPALTIAFGLALRGIKNYDGD